MINDDDSSEGIVASSDDEYDELSKAVEHHIFNQGSLPRREGELQPHQRHPLESPGIDPIGIWRKPQPAEYYDQRFSYQEEYRHRRFDDEIHNLRERHRPPSPYQRSRQYHYGAEEAPPSRVRPSRYFDRPQSSAIHKAPLPLMHRRIAEPSWRHDRLAPYPPIASRDIYSGENAPLRGPEVQHEIQVGYAGSHHALGVSDPRYQPNDTDYRVKDTVPRSKTLDNARERFLHYDHNMQSHSDSYLDRDHPPHVVETAPLGDLINESLLHYGRKPEKLPPKPISFKIKSTKPEEKSFHPLDRFAPPTENEKASSPERWLHDKYDDKESDATQETSGSVEAKQGSNNGTNEDTTNSTDIGEVQKSVPQNPSSVLHQSESPEGLIHAKKDADSVYEIVETITEVVECTEANRMNESSDDDEELLGLRLKALSSALAEDKKVRNVTKKKSSRKKRLKNLIHRVHDSPQLEKKKNLIHRVYDSPQLEKKKSGHSKRSGTAESLLDRYSPLPSSEKLKSVGSKPKASQLTLLGEMVKNYHPAAALKKMKCKPELRRSSQSSTCQTSEQLQHKSLEQVETSKKEIEKPELVQSAYVPSVTSISKTELVDNYDEMEMELEDGTSDSGLLPPGVDQTTSEEPVSRVSSSSNKSKLLNVTTGVKQTGNSTPSQESIWSMLEQGAPSDSHSNAEENHEQQKIEIIQTLESRRMSFEDCDDDDAILKLRQSLLRQLDKNIKKDGEDDQVPADEAKPAPLPSQFPYKPPELKIVSATMSTRVSSVSAVSTSTVPAVTTCPVTSCIQTSTVQTTAMMSIGDLQPTTPITISTSSYSHDLTPKALLADTSITVQPTSSEVSASTPRVFVPQTASTPAVDSKMPVLRNRAKRRRKRRKSTTVPNLGASSQNADGVFHNDKLSKPKQKSNILKPAVTNVATMPKPSTSHSTAPKTLVKTATTIIRSTTVRSTAASAAAIKSASSPNKEILQYVKSSNDRPKPLLQLPRHQPVVVNIGSSDEEESMISPNKPSTSLHDPMQMQRDKLTEMIKQMRVLAAARQNAGSIRKNASEELGATQKSSSRHSSDSSADVYSSQKVTNAAKRLRTRFLKIRAMIQKDEIKFNQVKTAEEAKKLELKATEDELKQMMHRIAAIKSKKTRCEEVLADFSKQGKVIRNRLQKRYAQRKSIQEKLQNQFNRSKQNNVSLKETKQNVPARNNASPALHPSSGAVTKLDKEKQRLLAREQKLAEKISQMKKTEVPGAVVRKRSLLSNEVQSHLAKYRKMKTSSNPTAHDLSLNKIIISVPSPAKQSSPGSNLNRDVEQTNKPESPKSKESHHVAIEDTVEQTSISDASMKLRKIVASNITAYKPFASYDPVLSYEAEPFAEKYWEQSTPAPIQKWKMKGNALPTDVQTPESQAIISIDMTYHSPLRLFRSYRLNPFLRVKEKLSIRSATFSHKMDPRKILCRYDLSGKCQDPNCKAQHADQYQLSTDELIGDLLLYSPSLLGKNIAPDIPHDSLIEMAQSACDKLLGVSTAQKNMSVDEKCILIASRVNSSLENKAPYTTVFKPRAIKLRQHNKETLVSPVTVHKEKVEVASTHQENGTEEPDSYVEQTKRYFDGSNIHDIEKLEAAVKKDPKSMQLWLKLTDKRMKANDSNRLELALHTMCLALEDNPYSGELWAYYLNLLHARKGGQSNEDLDEMVSQAIELVPLSTHIWDLLLSWESNVMKMEILLDQLVSNIVKSVEEPEGSPEDHAPEFLSNWLLETLLRKVQLLLYRSSVDDALDQFSHMIDSFVQQRAWAITNSGRHCLLPNDICILKLCFVNIKHFKCLPRCFLADIRPLDFIGMMHAVKIHKNADVQLHFSSSAKLQDMFSSLLSDLDVSIEDCKIGTEVSMACFPLLWEKLRLLKAHESWNEARSLCRMICENVQRSLLMEDLRFGLSVEKLNRILSDCIIISADCLAKLGNIHEATQMFENAINDSKTVDGKLCFEAALLQSRVDSGDIEAVLLYLEAYISSFFESESKCLDANSLKLMLKYLLRLPIPKKRKIPEFIDGVSWATVEKAKPALWLMYSLLLQTTGAKYDMLCNCYEQAIFDVADVSGKRELWLRYIRCKQAVALSLCATVKAKRPRWVWNFSSFVKRCLTATSPHLSSHDVESRDCYYSDYTFHNQVSAVYLSCFSTRQQTASAYNFLTEIMPYNSLLILRACKFHLSRGDHQSVVSTVWKITTNTKCQNETIWKISISSHFLTGRIAKAVRLAKQAVESVPFSSQLWSDYLSLLKAYGMPAEFVAEKVRCTNVLQVDASRLITDS